MRESANGEYDRECPHQRRFAVECSEITLIIGTKIPATPRRSRSKTLGSPGALLSRFVTCQRPRRCLRRRYHPSRNRRYRYRRRVNRPYPSCAASLRRFRILTSLPIRPAPRSRRSRVRPPEHADFPNAVVELNADHLALREEFHHHAADMHRQVGGAISACCFVRVGHCRSTSGIIGSIRIGSGLRRM